MREFISSKAWFCGVGWLDASPSGCNCAVAFCVGLSSGPQKQTEVNMRSGGFPTLRRDFGEIFGISQDPRPVLDQSREKRGFQ